MTNEDTVKALNVHIDGSVDCSNCPLKDMPECFKYLVNEVKRLLEKDVENKITEEQAIDKLTESGWLFEHDRIMTRRPQGEWKATGQTIGFYYVYACNKCGIYNKGKTNFCPNCGADMR